MSFSRREFLAILAGGCGAAAACAAGGLGFGGLAYWLSRERDSQVVVITSTPQITEVAAIPETGVTLVSHAEWGGLEPNHLAENEFGFYSDENPLGWRVYEGSLADIYTMVVLHHSVIYAADDVSTLLEVQNLHRNDRKWADVGYHYLIGKNGVVYEGRPVNVRGVHVAGYNTGSVGVCLLGNFMEELPTEAQLQSTRTVINWLTSTLLLTQLGPHRAFNDNTVCPGDNFLPYLSELAAANGLSLVTETPVEPTSSSFKCSCHI